MIIPKIDHFLAISDSREDSYKNHFIAATLHHDFSKFTFQEDYLSQVVSEIVGQDQ